MKKLLIDDTPPANTFTINDVFENNGKFYGISSNEKTLIVKNDAANIYPYSYLYQGGMTIGFSDKLQDILLANKTYGAKVYQFDSFKEAAAWFAK